MTDRSTPGSRISLLWALLPWFAMQRVEERLRAADVNVLEFQREVHRHLLASWALFVAVSGIAPLVIPADPDRSAYLVGMPLIAVGGVVAVVLARWPVVRAGLSDEVEVAAAFRREMFLRYVPGGMVAWAGWVAGLFVAPWLWPAGAVVGFVGAWAAAPSRGRIRREAARLAGSGVDLERALALPIGQVSGSEARSG